jgi:hypothetical protein
MVFQLDTSPITKAPNSSGPLEPSLLGPLDEATFLKYHFSITVNSPAEAICVLVTAGLSEVSSQPRSV